MRKLITIKLAMLLVLAAMAAPAAARVIYERDSLYSHLVVEDTAGVRTLYFNRFAQSTMSLRDPAAGGLEYTEMFHAVLAFKPDCKHVLVIGLGGGSTQKAFLARYPDITVHTVEIDPQVLQVAREYFALPESSRHQVTIEDGRRFLARPGPAYDAILVDAYLVDYFGAYAPFHLATREFFTAAKQRLADGGVLAYNVIWSSLSWNDASARAMYKTMGSVFDAVYLLPARRSRNLVMVGFSGPGAPDLAALRRNASAVDRARGRLPVSIGSLAGQIVLRNLDVSRVPVLTDDYAPVETLGLLFR